MAQAQQKMASFSGTNAGDVTAPADPTTSGPVVNMTAVATALEAHHPDGLLEWSSDGAIFRAWSGLALPFRFKGNCIYFPNGEVLCGENLLGTPLNTPPPVVIGVYPIITFPVNGATGINPAALTVVWTGLTGGTQYELELSGDPAFGTTVVDVLVIGTSYAVPSGTLSGGTLYYARVRETAPTPSLWSPVIDFTTSLLINCGLWNGVDDYLTLASDLAFGTGDFTVGMWVETTADGTLWQSGYNGSALNLVNILISGAGQAYVDVRNATSGDITMSGGADLRDALPHLIVFSCARAGSGVNGGNMSLSVDGGAVHTQGGPGGSVTAGGAATRIGWGIGGGQSHYNGKGWGVAAYFRALSPAEIATWYTSGNPPGSPSNFYSFLEGSGSVAHDTQGGDTATWSGTGTHWSTR